MDNITRELVQQFNCQPTDRKSINKCLCSCIRLVKTLKHKLWSLVVQTWVIRLEWSSLTILCITSWSFHNFIISCHFSSNGKFNFDNVSVTLAVHMYIPKVILFMIYRSCSLALYHLHPIDWYHSTYVLYED